MEEIQVCCMCGSASKGYPGKSATDSVIKAIGAVVR
ncbi:hypothetical protein YYY_03970 [Anaplasma phagocytophilum str. Dog2]|uniref:Uncharacterized protein n=1 Tax=Anaplasma phagocytophilum (strain HZ) TaxID=212042 RepID=Q2GJL2_ANAPZ|nr:hypothetical protein APH_0862 [Anaplasma phagocytophilum str. HZ]AGR80773.1 hypothetical protein WSQ_03980 [Anaplasma phagocytophilum str. JM]AGR82025.1 hypothetical protein YYY_03970 [Anaplasma phagocytophilum str. Dog2]